MNIPQMTKFAKPNLAQIEDSFRSLMEEGLGISLSDPNFKDTPKRVAKAYAEMLSGVYHEDINDILSTAFPAGGYNGIVLAGPFETCSMCPHHFLPVIYEMFVAYIPKDGGKYLGISKLVRIADILSRRPVLQEQLGVDISNVLATLAPQGSAVVIKGIHNCMACRGVKKKAPITTSYIKGCFEKEPAARQELFDLMRMAK